MLTSSSAEISLSAPAPVAVLWQEILCQQNRKLHNFIRKRVSNREDVEDIAQMTCVEVLRNSHKFLGASRPETWLFGIAANLIRNYYKTHQNRFLFDSINEENVLELVQECDPSDIIANDQLLGVMAASIDRLPEETRRMLTILVERNGSYQDVATSLNIPLGTVKSRLSRVRETLKSTIS
ncbi:RNA polymerase sigma factor [Erwinia sp. BNK-24-b]|uniref:RNA polymerase sigma factor n=1 Tax=Erwinia TaxID=551 RepID=UPI001FEDA754|nr:RNA polymerase sigma factor [Erwinia phyllosphaerae]MBV4368590.1 RNA polymerase sigma factor [Erwinia phyllosphaerae]